MELAVRGIGSDHLGVRIILLTVWAIPLGAVVGDVDVTRRLGL